VSTQFQKRPYDTSFNLSVHGLLVVDAMQTYGRDFELLVASHKNLFMDSRSGTIHDSPQSPPGTPDLSMLSSGTGASGLRGSAMKIPYLGEMMRSSSPTGSHRSSSRPESPNVGHSRSNRVGSGKA
jgi:hypothetical protein